MLVLSRKLNDEICVGDDIRIRILKIKGNTIRIGIEAPHDVRVIRGELEFQIDDLECLKGEKEISASEKRNQATEETTEESPVEVSIVFQNLAKSTTRIETADVIPFVAKRKSLNNSDRRIPEQPTEENETYRTIQFRQPLPMNLRNNRLKDLVHEITRPKK